MSTEEKTISHHPVMVNEVLAALGCEKGTLKVYMDCTVGLGGHMQAILEAGGRDISAIGIDRDEDALEMTQKRLEGSSDRLVLQKGHFREILKIIERLNYREVDGFLFDLGVSSYQLENAERGFSFRKPGPLDMRMDRGSGESAAALINRLTQTELKAVIQKYGEERWAGQIATNIVRYRSQNGEIVRTEELEQIIWAAIPKRFRYGRLHPATRTFQALRMVVNQELEQIQAGLAAAISLLALGGRIVVISFHSLEDRCVKRTFKQWSQLKEEKEGKRFINLYKKPLRAGPVEVAQNRRARSAKLRVLERSA